MESKEFKPNLKWLQKVADGGVYRTWNYSSRRGGYSKFVGGEKTYNKHREAGYVGYCPSGSLGRCSVLQLTEKGASALKGI
jgi:hypothetical protein